MFNKKYLLIPFVAAAIASTPAYALIPPGPAQPADYLSLPKGKTYFAFGYDVKKALDRDYIESSEIARPRGGRNLTKIIRKGGGVYVKLGRDTYNVHVGYTPTSANGGENTGRSFGVGPDRGGHAGDLTYPELFKIMQDYFDDETDVAGFYRAFFKILIFSDASAMEDLDDDGRQVMSDLIAIYGAELNRNIMSNLQDHHWQKHLGDVTMLASLHAATGLIWNADEGKLDTGILALVIGHGSAGSGVGGKTSLKRLKFQRSLTKRLKKTHPAITERIETLIGKQSDLFHGLMEHLNQRTIPNGNEIIEAYVDLMVAVRRDGKKIAQAL